MCESNLEGIVSSFLRHTVPVIGREIEGFVRFGSEWSKFSSSALLTQKQRVNDCSL